MSSRIRTLLCAMAWSWLGILALGCATAGNREPAEEDEDIEARAMRTEMLEHRGRLEPKTGIVFPINNQLSNSDPGSPVIGMKGQFEAVSKGMWFGVEFNFVRMDTQNPVPSPLPSGVNLLTLKTEQLLERVDRYEAFLTWDYDIPLGDGPYWPLFRLGLALGAVAFHGYEAPGNSLLQFDDGYTFVGRPSVGFRFPFTEHIGAFVEGSYDYMPKVQFSGRQTGSPDRVNIGNDVEFSAANVMLGISFEF
jgi:hypothetical protein